TLQFDLGRLCLVASRIICRPGHAWRQIFAHVVVKLESFSLSGLAGTAQFIPLSCAATACAYVFIGQRSSILSVESSDFDLATFTDYFLRRLKTLRRIT